MGDWDRYDDEAEDAEPPANLPAPWEQPDYGADAAPPRRARHDAFTPARRAKFLKYLSKSGCLTDAAGKAGVAPRTVYNHQDKDGDFARDCAHAIRLAAGRMELVAFERAVIGVDEQFACGGQVYVRKRYSDSLLRLLLQGTHPKKYGPRPGLTRKRLLAWERKRIEEEIYARIEAEQEPIEQVRARILTKLDAIEAHKAAAGEPAEDGEDGGGAAPGTPRDSLCKS